MKRIYFPYIIGSDSPIANLYQNIASKLNSTQFSTTLLRNKRSQVIDAPNVTEIYGFNRKSPLRFLPHTHAALHSHDLIHTGGYPRLRYLLSRITRFRNKNIKQVHSLRVDVDPDEDYHTTTKQKLVDISDVVTAVSQHTAETAKKYLDVSPRVIYNCVNTEVFKPDLSEPTLLTELGIKKPILLYVGSFVRRKRPHAVLEVAKKQEDFDVLMVGDGRLYDDIATKANDINNLYVIGRVEKRKLPAVYANAAGFVFPTVREGCPNVVLEAMAAGLPVIGYQATSMPELVANDMRGYLVEPDNIEALCDAVDQLNDTALSNELGINAREYVKKNHSIDKITTQYQSVYEEMLL